MSDETASRWPKCENTQGLVKILTSFTTSPRSIPKTKVGDITEQFIEDAKQDLKRQKEDV